MFPLVKILVELLRAGTPLPNFHDQAGVEAWLVSIAPVEAEIVVQLVGQQSAVAATLGSPSIAAELQDAMLTAGFDGSRIAALLKWLETNGPQVIQVVMTIIALLPKQPQPNVAPVA